MLNTAEEAGKKFGDLLTDEEIRWLWARFAYVTLRRLGLQHPVREKVQEVLDRQSETLDEGDEEMIFVSQLLDAIKEKRPDVYHIVGEHLVHLQQFTFAVLRAWAPDDPTKEALLKAARQASPQTVEIDHFSDNPITVHLDPMTGEPYLTNVEKAKPKHFMQIKAYFDSLRPARPVGRPHGAEKPKGSGKKPVDPEDARRVYQCTQDGLDLWQAARKVLRVTIPSDPKARERLRGKLRHLLAVGTRLAQKKLDN